MRKTAKLLALVLVFCCFYITNIQAMEEGQIPQMQQFTVEAQSMEGDSEKINVYQTPDGIWMLPVRQTVEKMGYHFEECSRCGKDEIYDPALEDNGGKGHFFVNWYQSLLSYSASKDMVELKAENDKVEGVTYGPQDLFEAMGLSVEIDTKQSVIKLAYNRVVAVYFYSSTCDTCQRTEEFLKKLKEKYTNLNVVEYNIYSTLNYDLLMEYGKQYKLPEEKQGFTPSVFISDQVIIGAEIEHKLEAVVEKYKEMPPTLILKAGKYETKLEKKSLLLHILSAVGLGFVNGLSPCSLSMFLFLVTLLVAAKDKMLRCGISFLAGKVCMFFLLGTVFYQLMSRIHMSAFSKWMKIFMIAFTICFALLNLVDFFFARAERYEKMHLQLPKKLKQWNQKLMRWGEKFVLSKWCIVVMVGIGMAVATGEFLCTGQIYLSSIVVLVQKNTAGYLPTLLLFLYSVAFVIPLFIIMLIMSFGKKAFGISEAVLEKIPWIKLISSILFIIIAVYMIFTIL